MPIPWEKERWDIGLPRELDEIMARRGVGIYPWAEVPPSEVPFYRWESQEGLLKSIAEADRALLAGSMEYVPASRLAEVLESSTISPWTIVDQGGGKWRLYQCPRRGGFCWCWCWCFWCWLTSGTLGLPLLL